jgi:hypothetical protein
MALYLSASSAMILKAAIFLVSSSQLKSQDILFQRAQRVTISQSYLK